MQVAQIDGEVLLNDARVIGDGYTWWYQETLGEQSAEATGD